ncbi:SPOC domain-like protein [Cutaneotrichosporon oleaginosum]|uniref:ATP-dependent DNA helicase II subunit 1 n=1 Tax=Cutaneotrichosporon oleaginosum TaxID=879819 RepID=A0A0J0XIT2_9TREE|nr:SPOC domain-like protein [Cutaneotrichosporon oleaginosum]KLT41005.1 SPOC domain-like protein [Cutaneotrichosporon oleaginosum]TXT06270.1 hypothetical protein COLE_05601 [Cutaneotrichosporon oleaginosum]
MSSSFPASGFNSQWDIDVGYDDDVIDQSEYQYAARDHILFCIDASQSMQTPAPDDKNEAGVIRGKSPLHQALDAVVKIERTKVITGPSDSVGVLLYNIDSAKAPPSGNGSVRDGTYVVQPLRTISAEEIKRLIKLLERANDEYAEQEDGDAPTVEPTVLRENFPPVALKDELNTAGVFQACMYLFRDAGNRVTGNKRVFLITDQDEPPGAEVNRSPARTVFTDMTAYGVSINTFFINRPGHLFNANTFWNDILQRPETLEGSSSSDGMEDLTDLISELVVRQAPKRKQFSIPLKFGGRDGDIEIGVAGYALISEQKKGTSKMVRMRGRTVEEVQTRTIYTSAETGGDLLPDQLTSAFEFGAEAKIENMLERDAWEQGQEEDRDEDGDLRMDGASGEDSGEPKLVAKTRLKFTDEQIRSYKTLDIEPPRFQSPEHLVMTDNIKHSYFIYPDESTYTGSTRAFTALLRSCIKLDRHALALCRFRASSSPEFAVLVPQEETINKKEGGQEDPPGFHVVILPFVDDIRDPPKKMTYNLTATDEETKAMERLMRRLRFKSGKYVSDVYPNPALQYHQKQLQALAFDEDFDTEEFDDKALPKYLGIHKAAGQLMKDWKKLIDDDERAVETALNPPSKRHVVAIDPADLQDIPGAYRNGTLEKLKVQELRDYAKANGISLSGLTRKADIIDAITDHLAQDTGAKKSKHY